MSACGGGACCHSNTMSCLSDVMCKLNGWLAEGGSRPIRRGESQLADGGWQ